jgi:hypothetical protein
MITYEQAQSEEFGKIGMIGRRHPVGGSYGNKETDEANAQAGFHCGGDRSWESGCYEGGEVCRGQRAFTDRSSRLDGQEGGEFRW